MKALFAILRKSFCLRLLTISALTIFADCLFYPQYADGSSIGFFCFVIIGALLLHNPGIMRHRKAQIIVLLTGVQAGLLIWDFSMLSMLLTAAGIITLATICRRDIPDNALIWAKSCVLFGLRVFGPFLHMLCQYKKSKRRFLAQKPHDALRVRIRGWVFPVIGSIAFLYLFSTINPLIERVLMEFSLWQTLEQFNIFHCMVLFIWFCVLLAIIRPGKVSRQKSRNISLRESHAPSLLMTPASMMRGLVLFNLIFALQTGQDYLNLMNNTALEYIVSNAQNAAYTLVVTALLAAAIILRARQSGYHRQKLIAAMIYLWIGQNVLLLVSAVLRLQTYISLYHLTYLRFAALVWMGIVAMGFVWILYANYRDKSSRWLINVNVVSVLTILYMLSFVDIGGIIAGYNLRRASSSLTAEKSLDTYYIKHKIGLDALPYLRQYEGRFSCATRPQLASMQEEMLGLLQVDLMEFRRWSIKKFLIRRRIMRIMAPPNCLHQTGNYHG